MSKGMLLPCVDARKARKMDSPLEPAEENTVLPAPLF